MFVLVLFLIGVRVGDDCLSKTEATCSDGCAWTNLTGACLGGACGGSPSCAAATESGCSSTIGCTWEPTSNASCDGTPTCTGQADQDACETLLGCSWITTDTATCTGAPTTCSGNSAANCALAGCTYTSTAIPAACTGDSSVSCDYVINAASCGVVDYCEWSDPTPPYCYVDAEFPTCEDSLSEEYGSMGPIYCSWVPGCTYTGSIGTCSGTISKTCSELSYGDCEAAGCHVEPEGECKSHYSCSNFDSNEEQCNAMAGCAYDNDTETCTGVPSSCSVYDNNISECQLHESDCYFQYARECVVPSKCSILYEAAGCEAAGCGWDAEEYKCSGTVTTKAATCSALSGSSSSECQNAGCYAEYKYYCTGSIEFTSCTDWGYGGTLCTSLGCQSTGYSEGTCTGTVDRTAGASVTTEAACIALGQAFAWYEGDEGGCQQTAYEYTPKKCSDFTSKEICYGLKCPWQEAVPVGCAGTPTNAGNQCASFAVQDQCTGNQCTWVPAGGRLCTGSPTETCSDKSASAETCANISGCAYTAPVDTAYCTGTAQGFCNGGTSTSCENVNGCTWTGCSPSSSQTGCASSGGCTWNQPGLCKADSDAASFVYAPALLVLLLLLTLIL